MNIFRHIKLILYIRKSRIRIPISKYIEYYRVYEKNKVHNNEILSRPTFISRKLLGYDSSMNGVVPELYSDIYYESVVYPSIYIYRCYGGDRNYMMLVHLLTNSASTELSPYLARIRSMCALLSR